MFLNVDFMRPFKENGNIISYSPLKFIGEKNDPILIKNINGKGGNGIAIINAKKKSLIRNVNFLNLDSIQNNRIILTGGVTFYESPLEIYNCIFENGSSEDSLNIVRSNFILDNIIINNSASDALDIDFSNGLISNLYIENSQNDGLDVSGSRIKVKSCWLHDDGGPRAQKSLLRVVQSKHICMKKPVVVNHLWGPES